MLTNQEYSSTCSTTGALPYIWKSLMGNSARLHAVRAIIYAYMRQGGCGAVEENIIHANGSDDGVAAKCYTN